MTKQFKNEVEYSRYSQKIKINDLSKTQQMAIKAVMKNITL